MIQYRSLKQCAERQGLVRDGLVSGKDRIQRAKMRAFRWLFVSSITEIDRDTSSAAYVLGRAQAAQVIKGQAS